MLYSYLQDAAARHPDRPAVDAGDDSCTYRQLWRRSGALARTLQATGVTPGDRVAILGADGIGTIVAWWAVLRCHAICVNINESLTASGVRYILDDISPRAHVCCGPSAHEAMLTRAPVVPVDDADGAEDTDVTCPVPADPGTIASIIYTSGSTGAPKGVCLSHRNLQSSGDIAARGHAITGDDRYLMIVPLHYVHGQMMMLSVFMRGASLEFMQSFVFPAMVTRRLEERAITGFSGVPYHFANLVKRGRFLTTELPSLRWIGITGGAIAQDVLLDIASAKPGLQIHIGYGQTECSPRISRLDPGKLLTKPTSIGSAEPGLTVDITDERGVNLPDGETGELLVSGPSVMHGYWNDAAGTARVIDEAGRLRTGDLAYRDPEGDLFIRGRRQAMIKSAGERIFPEELENVLRAHPDVAEVAVIGEPDALYGQVVVAHVELVPCDRSAPDARLEGVRSHCLEHVTFAKAPRHYRVWEELPRRVNGKVDKQALADRPPAGKAG